MRMTVEQTQTVAIDVLRIKPFGMIGIKQSKRKKLELMMIDLLTVEYTELDSGCPALCFASDLIVPITNKTMAKSYCNYMNSDLRFKINQFKIQNLMFSYIDEDRTEIKGKVNSTFALMGYAESDQLYNAMRQVVSALENPHEV